MAAATSEDLAYRKRLTRCSNLRNASTAKAAVQAITEAESRYCCSSSSCVRRVDGEGSNGGARQVKLVIRRKELKQMVATLGWVNDKFTSAGLEQFFNALRKKQLRKAELETKGGGSSRWEPALLPIPEES